MAVTEGLRLEPMAMTLVNDGISFPVAHMHAIFNVAWSLADRAVIGDVATFVTSEQMAFAPGLLAEQVLL